MLHNLGESFVLYQNGFFVKSLLIVEKEFQELLIEALLEGLSIHQEKGWLMKDNGLLLWLVLVSVLCNKTKSKNQGVTRNSRLKLII